ncbi:MAG: DUF1467 family protein, partial [Rhodospirillales bacterium]|nr:DUF1467 family protein [Rhodospirillales bacterium]
IVWWMVLFTTLPFGNRASDNPEPGHADSAPEKPRMWLKAAVTTGIATVVWGVIYWVIDSNLISLR